jgi:uncharacterized protein YrrD
MLYNLKDLFDYTVQGKDEEVGHVHDFYFHDQRWEALYLIIDTGPWFFGKKILAATEAVGVPIQEDSVLPVDLTKEQIQGSPAIDLTHPISDRQLAELHVYYNWTQVGSPVLEPKLAYLPPGALVESEIRPSETAEKTEQPNPNPYLRSAREVMGYHINARDGEIGHVESFLINPQDWYLRYIIVDTRNWLPGHKVLISPVWIEDIRWAEQEVYVELKRETIKNSPEYDPTQPVERGYEERLYRHYGRRGYWTEEEQSEG